MKIPRFFGTKIAKNAKMTKIAKIAKMAERAENAKVAKEIIISGQTSFGLF